MCLSLFRIIIRIIPFEWKHFRFTEFKNDILCTIPDKRKGSRLHQMLLQKYSFNDLIIFVSFTCRCLRIKIPHLVVKEGHKMPGKLSELFKQGIFPNNWIHIARCDHTLLQTRIRYCGIDTRSLDTWRGKWVFILWKHWLFVTKKFKLSCHFGWMAVLVIIRISLTRSIMIITNQTRLPRTDLADKITDMQDFFPQRLLQLVVSIHNNNYWFCGTCLLIRPWLQRRLIIPHLKLCISFYIQFSTKILIT